MPPLGEDWLLNNDFFLIMFFFFRKHSIVIAVKYFIEYCSVIFRLIRDNFNFPVFKANEQITKYAQRCLEKM